MRTGIAPFLSGFCILALAPLAGAQEPAHQPLVAIDYLYPLTAEYGLPSRILIDYVERAFNAKYRQWGAHQLLADESLELPPHVAKAAWSFVSGGEGAGTWLWIDGELVTKYWWNWKTLPEVITQRTGFRAKEVGVRLLEMGPHDVGGPASGAGETLLALWGLVGFLVCDGPQQIGAMFVHPKDRFPLTDDGPAPEAKILRVWRVRGVDDSTPLDADQWKQALALLAEWARDNEWKRIEAGGTASVPVYYRWCQQLPREWYEAAGFTVAEVEDDVNRQAIENMRNGPHGSASQKAIQQALASGLTIDDIATQYHMVWE